MSVALHLCPATHMMVAPIFLGFLTMSLNEYHGSEKTHSNGDSKGNWDGGRGVKKELESFL